jgi:hypothetical protein
MIKRKLSKRNKKLSKRNLSKRKLSKRNLSKRKHNLTNKKQRGGNDLAMYPKVYGIENKAVLYPISEYGIPGGFFVPPVDSNGPNGNGPYYGGRRNRNKRGGGNQHTLFPQSLVDIERSLSSGLSKTLNGFEGVTNSASLNPMPYDQPIDTNEHISTYFPNVAKMYNDSDKFVSTL